MTERIVFLVILIVIPVTLMGWAMKRAYAGRIEALLVALFNGLLIVFLFQWGQYPYVGSYYLRYILFILLGAMVFLVFRAAARRPWVAKMGVGKRIFLGLLALGCLGLISLNWLAFQARFPNSPTVDMEFPLRDATYYISSGGSNGVLNLHHKPNTPSQMYAIDIDRLGGLGGSSNGLLPDELEDYSIFGQTVYSPSDGHVIEVRNDILDHPALEYDSASGSGNYVIIEREDGLQVALLHLMQGSVTVQLGDQVKTGTVLGKVGNSGFSLEPHLHFQVSRSTSDGSRVGVPVRFQDRFLVRNSIFYN